MSQIRSVILATGAYLPRDVVTNADLAARGVDTNDEWIVQRTGIRQRHIAGEGEMTSQMATAAAKQAMERAGITVADIDAIIVATTTPDDTFPATAVKVQAALGMEHGFAFDVQAVCSGFVYALSVADGMIKSGQARRIIVIGAERMTALLDWEDRTTCVLFGDGAGCVILEARADNGQGAGIISTHLHSDGRHRDLLYTDGGAGSTGTVGKLKMEGREVFKYAVSALASVVDEVLSANNLKPDDIALLVPHQANLRIIEGTAKKLDMGMDRVIVTVDRHGNTSAASIPLALNEAVVSGRAKRGELLLLEAMGGGFTWGAVLVRY